MRILMVLLSVLFLSNCTIVSPGERGIRVKLGTTNNEFCKPGPYLWFPFLLGMAKIDVQIQKSEAEAEAASKDMQTINAKFALNWKIDEQKVVEIYRTIGDEYDILDRLIDPAISEVLKAETAKHSAEEVLTKRLELKKAIDTSITERLKKYGVEVTDINIINLSFSKEYTHAIEQKQIAEQQAKQAEYDAQKAIQEAKSEYNRAEGQAKAQNLLKTTLTPELLKLKAIEKWNGAVPQIMGSGSNMLFNIPIQETTNSPEEVPNEN